MSRRRARNALDLGLMLVIGLAGLLVAGTVAATETTRWVVDRQEDLLGGKGQGVAVTEDGRLVRVEQWQAGPAMEEPVVLAGVVLADGTVVVGTGHPARLYRLGNGKPELLAEPAEQQITAIAAEPDGNLLVATVTPGVLYRWHAKNAELQEVGRLGEGGIWDLGLFDGVMVAAAGPPASLYRVTRRGLERWAELPDTHARCLAGTPDGLAVGTSGKGLILGVSASGQVAMLADSPFTEISDLLAAPDGSLWATAVVGEPTPPKPGQSQQQEGDTATTQTVATDLALPKVNGASATSEVLRLTPEGALLEVHRFTKQVAGALAWDGTGVLVGTGYDGEVWRFTSSGGAQLAVIDAVQVVGILGGGSHLLTQGPAQILVQSAGEQPGSFRSSPKKLSLPAHFGAYRIDPPSPQVRIRFRSGIASQPDDTWLAWSEWLPGSGGTVPLPPGQSLQWELEIPPGSSEGVERIEVAYQEVNLAPRFEDVTVEEPGVVYLGGVPPSGPVIEVEHPDVSGIFSVIDEKGNGGTSPQGKKYWRVGYRTVVWKVEDENKDPLRFAIEVESRKGFRLPVREHLETTQLGLDTTALPDGWYRFRITASDRERNPANPLQTTALSEWFVADSSPPEITLARRDGHWQVTVEDKLSPLTQVEWSRDGDTWHGLDPEDGILDGPQERFRFAAEPGHHLVVVRAIDSHHNRTTAGAVEE